jgi:hypothetical protein
VFTQIKLGGGKMDKYSFSIMKDVRRNLGLDLLDKSRDEEIMNMDKHEVFDRVCNWNGFIGWSKEFKCWVDIIYKENNPT